MTSEQELIQSFESGTISIVVFFLLYTSKVVLRFSGEGGVCGGGGWGVWGGVGWGWGFRFPGNHCVRGFKRLNPSHSLNVSLTAKTVCNKPTMTCLDSFAAQVIGITAGQRNVGELLFSLPFCRCTFPGGTLPSGHFISSFSSRLLFFARTSSLISDLGP